MKKLKSEVKSRFGATAVFRAALVEMVDPEGNIESSCFRKQLHSLKQSKFAELATKILGAF